MAGASILILVAILALVVAWAGDRRLQAERRATDHNRYASDVQSALRAWQAGEMRRVDQVLARLSVNGSETDHRGWEWYYLASLRHRENLTIRGSGLANSAVVFSPGGDRLAAAGPKDAKIWDAVTGEELVVLRGHLARVEAVSWSPDGRYLATGSRDKSIRIFDATSGGQVSVLAGSAAGISKVAWNSSGDRILASNPRESIVWDISSSDAASRVMPGRTTAVFSPDGTQLACLAEHRIEIRDALTLERSSTLDASPTLKPILEWNAALGRLVSIDTDGGLHLWNAHVENQALFTPTGVDQVSAMTVSPDGNEIAIGREGGSIVIWDREAGRMIRLLRGHTSRVVGLDWHPTAELLASIDSRNTIKVWDTTQDQEARILSEHSRLVRAVAWSADGRRLASASDDRTVQIWDADTHEMIQRMELSRAPAAIHVLAWCPTGRRLAYADADVIHIVDTNDVSNESILAGHRRYVTALAWSPDGQLVASGSRDCSVRIWDAEKCQELCTLTRTRRTTEDLEWSPDGRSLAIADGEKIVRLWDVRSRQVVTTLDDHYFQVTALAWSPGGAEIATAGAATHIRVWSALDGREIANIHAHARNVWSIDWSPGGRRLASASADGALKIWDPRAGLEMLTLRKHHKDVYTAAWSPDGHRLATSSLDGTIRIWDAAQAYRDASGQ